jgi:hypothetical protein
MDCFAALAMTAERLQLPPSLRGAEGDVATQKKKAAKGRLFHFACDIRHISTKPILPSAPFFQTYMT